MVSMRSFGGLRSSDVLSYDPDKLSSPRIVLSLAPALRVESVADDIPPVDRDPQGCWLSAAGEAPG